MIILKHFKGLVSHHTGLVVSFLPGSLVSQPSPFSPAGSLLLIPWVSPHSVPPTYTFPFPGHLGTKVGEGEGPSVALPPQLVTSWNKETSDHDPMPQNWLSLSVLQLPLGAKLERNSPLRFPSIHRDSAPGT